MFWIHVPAKVRNITEILVFLDLRGVLRRGWRLGKDICLRNTIQGIVKQIASANAQGNSSTEPNKYSPFI